MVAVGASAVPSGTTTLTDCTPGALSAAASAGGTVDLSCSGTISLATPIVVSGVGLTIDATGQNVTLTAPPGEGTRIFGATNGAKVTLVNLKFTGAVAQGHDGADGGAGVAGAAGHPGNPAGGNGGTGGNGDDGINGTPQVGGALSIDQSSTVTLDHCTFSGNSVQGGKGGTGGNGADGGAGGNGADLVSGPGGSGGDGGDGGNGGNGGVALGGAVYNAGTLVVENSTFSGNVAKGGDGGSGGRGAGGGGGGRAGTFKAYDTVGSGGDGGRAGYGGKGGGGGLAVGAAIYSTGALTVRDSKFAGSSLLGGNGGAAGAAGGAGSGGAGSTVVANGLAGVHGGDGGAGGDGGNGGHGGKGGSALGAGIYAAGPVTLVGVTFSSGTAVGGDGGAPTPGSAAGGGGNGGNSLPNPAGRGGNGGKGGDGGDAGNGGGGGPALGGSVFSGSSISTKNVTSTGNTLTGGKGDPENGGDGGPGGAPGTGNPNGTPGKAGTQGNTGKNGSPGITAGTDIISGGVAAARSSGTLTQCPAVTQTTTGCNVLIDITGTNKMKGYYDPNQTPLDGPGGDDQLVGVVNHTAAPIDQILLTSPNIFGFDGEGLCHWTTCTWPAPTTYEGPTTTFTLLDSDRGIVHFAGGLQPGKSTYFSLEGATLFPCRIEEDHLGWHFESSQPASVDTGVLLDTITSPWGPVSVGPILGKLPVTKDCTLALPVVLPDLEIHVGSFDLAAHQNTLDDSKLVVGEGFVAFGNVEALFDNLSITRNLKIAADSAEIGVYGASLSATKLKIDPGAGTVTAATGSIALPSKLGDISIGARDIKISSAGVEATLDRGAFDIGDVHVAFTGAELLPKGFKIATADVQLPAYLGGAHLHGENISYDGHKLVVGKATGHIHFTVAGGRVTATIDGEVSIKDNGSYSFKLDGTAEIPSFLKAEAGVTVQSIECEPVIPPATIAPCTNAIYLKRLHLAVSGQPVLLGQTGLAVKGLSFSITGKPIGPQEHDAAGNVYGTSYTFDGRTDFLTAADQGRIFDGSLSGAVSSNGNFGVSIKGTTMGFVEVGGSVCIRVVDVAGDDVCDRLNDPYLTGTAGVGIFAAAHLGASIHYEGSLGNVAAGLSAHAQGRFAKIGNQAYLDATLGGELHVKATSWLLPDIEGSAALRAQLGLFATPSGSSIPGIKGTLTGDLKVHGTFTDTTVHVERSVFIDAQGGYTEDNVDQYVPTGTTSFRRAADARSASKTSYAFDIGPGQTQTLVTLLWKKGSAPPPLTLVSPDDLKIAAQLQGGAPQISITGPNVTPQQQSSAYVAGLAIPNVLQVYIPAPTVGRWTATVGKAQGAKLLIRSNKPLPNLSVAAVADASGSVVQINGSADATSVALYASPTACGANDSIDASGQLLKARVGVKNGAFTYAWKPTASGSYTIYAQADNGRGPLVRACADTPVAIVVKAHPDVVRLQVAARRPRRLELVTQPGVTPTRVAAPQIGRTWAASGTLPIFVVDDRTPLIALNDWAGIEGHFPGNPKPAPALSYVAPPTFTGTPPNQTPVWRQYTCKVPGPDGCALLTFGRLANPSTNPAPANRKAACGRGPFKNGNQPGPDDRKVDPTTGKVTDGKLTSCDEFPFASTTLGGGADAIVMGVTRRENNVQGGLISQFMQKNAVALSQSNGQFYVCVKITGIPTAGHCS